MFKIFWNNLPCQLLILLSTYMLLCISRIYWGALTFFYYFFYPTNQIEFSFSVCRNIRHNYLTIAVCHIGAELNATMEKTGETSLHLASRFARADAAKRLLDAAADANAQDFTGRTPLHAAVAADAVGVFQILLRNRATNLNARMHDGTTPLILAARLAIEGMVPDLISAEADINAADNSGKTALHWAAAVNNHEAVEILVAHGANRDAQDDKVRTFS